MGIFSKIHAYVLIKTRREFIHLRWLLEILEIGCFVEMNSYLACSFLIYF